MDIQVREGALVEVPTTDVTGVDRRAFGEFVGPRGELASYAFGWTTGCDPHVARLSIGIGADNPGGGTFDAVMFVNEDGHAFSLTDEPFERVPQGGPDLTADQARAHEDLSFVWWVTDHVMQRSTGLVDAALAPRDHLHPDPRGLRAPRAHSARQPRCRRRHVAAHRRLRRE